MKGTVYIMEIAIIACDQKKEIMTQFCTAYCGILAKHNLYATEITGHYISEATGLVVERVMSGGHGGTEQIASRVSCNEIDLVLFFRETSGVHESSDRELNLLRLCDVNNIPVATNIATAEALILAVDQGALDWRELVNPRSKLNRNKGGSRTI